VAVMVMTPVSTTLARPMFTVRSSTTPRQSIVRLLAVLSRPFQRRRSDSGWEPWGTGQLRLASTGTTCHTCGTHSVPPLLPVCHADLLTPSETELVPVGGARIGLTRSGKAHSDG
jgi:hypothetical protein